MTLRSLMSNAAARVALVYMGLAGLWILASDTVLGLLIDNASGSDLVQTLKGLVFVLVTTLLLYMLLRRQRVLGERRDTLIKAPPAWLPLIVFVLFSIGLIATGGFLFHVQQDQIRSNAQAQLKAVGELRIEQIRDWLAMSRTNAKHFGSASQRVREFDTWLKTGGTDAVLAETMMQRLSLIEASYGHVNITLFDTEGVPRLSKYPDPYMVEHGDEALQVMQTGATLLVDFHQHGQEKELKLGMIAPMTLKEAGGLRTVGAMFFSLPARKSLLHILQRWPVPSLTGETVLLHQRGNEIQMLFASRQPELLMTLPHHHQGDQEFGLEKLRRGERGNFTDEVDFRGNPVFAFGEQVPDTPWILVTKLDQSEVDAPVHRLARGSALITALLLLAAGLAAWLWWRAQINRQRAQLLSKELERQVLERHYDFLSRYANDAIFLVDMQGRLLSVNERVRDMYGIEPDDLIGQSANMLRPVDLLDGYENVRDQLLETGQLIYETVHQRKDGSRFPVEASARLIELEGLQRIHVSVRDISERKWAEQEMQAREARYRAVIESSADGFWLTDPSGRLLEVNDAYCRRSGYSREELLNMHISDLDASETPEDTARHMQEVIETGCSLFETLHRAKDGSVWQVEVNTSFASIQGGCAFVFLRDVMRRNRSESLLRTRLKLSDVALRSDLDSLMKASLDAAEMFTGSHIGFFHFVEPDQQSLTLQAWSTNTVDNMCTLEAQQQAKGQHYAVKLAGVWADAIRTRQPVIHNDYASLPDKQGLPAGHAPLLRELVVPILREDKVTAVLGVGNKAGDYTQDDVVVVQQIASMVMDVVARKRAEEALRESEAYNKLLFVDSRIAMVVMDPDTLRFIDCNQAAVDIYQLPNRQSVLSLTPVEVSDTTQYDGSASPELGQHYVQRALAEGSVVFEWRHRRPDGTIWDAQVNLMRFRHGERTLMQFTLEDITESKRAGTRLKQAAMVFESVADGILITDARQRIVAVNRAFTEVTGYTQAECLGQSPGMLRSGRHDEVFYREMWQTLSQVGYWHGEIWNRRQSGEVFPEWLAITAVKDDAGAVTGYIGVFTDLSEQHALKFNLDRATNFDPLTGLPNARKMLEQVTLAMKVGQIGDSQFGLLVLNVDRFAQLNESLGRSAGDSVLICLAQRWAKLLPDSALLARMDADQFAVLWVDDSVLAEGKSDVLTGIMATANSLWGSMAEPVEISGQQASVALTVSLGIALYPGDATDATALLHAAEDALRSAKADKGNQFRFFDRSHAQTAIDWFETETALRLALDQDELFLVFQPQIDASSGRVIAAESLLRWRHNGLVVAPNRFIHVVEGTDLAEPVSRWVLNTACRQAREWLDRNHPLRVAVNIFSDHVTSGHLLEDVRRALANTGLPAELLELEVVESSLLKRPELAAQTLREIKRLGVGLALDDFGTGYSSLGYLKHYPFDVLKIDQMFARNVTRDPDDAAIVRSTIGLAHNLGMRVLAEGVETEPQLRFMSRYGCDQIQGYLTSRPVSPGDVETMVMERRDLRPQGHVNALPRQSILIVEDEPIEAEMLMLLLEDSGYAAHSVAELDAAVTMMGKQRIDLVVADYYLERITGVEVLERLRRLFPDVPSIMVSGADESSVVMEAVNRGGIRAFLRKPVDTEELLLTIRRLLDQSENWNSNSR